MRLNTHELVTFSYTWSKTGGYTSPSAIAENPMLHANPMVLCFIEAELLPVEVSHCGILYLFCSCNLDHETMTFTYKLDTYSLDIYRTCDNELPTSRLLKVIV